MTLHFSHIGFTDGLTFILLSSFGQPPRRYTASLQGGEFSGCDGSTNR